MAYTVDYVHAAHITSAIKSEDPYSQGSGPLTGSKVYFILNLSDTKRDFKEIRGDVRVQRISSTINYSQFVILHRNPDPNPNP